MGNLPALVKELLKRKVALVFAVALLCIVLIVALNFLFSKSFGISCESYCQTQQHIECVGFWNISGQYPNCDCQYVCWSTKACSSDLDCGDGERCYNSFEAGEQVGDMFCHELCDINADCMEITPYCRRINITIGQASDLVKMCMMEQCAEDADCAQPRCIGMHAICDNGECKVVDTQGMPVRCG